jgi:hypothetical protein
VYRVSLLYVVLYRVGLVGSVDGVRECALFLVVVR